MNVTMLIKVTNLVKSLVALVTLIGLGSSVVVHVMIFLPGKSEHSGTEIAL